MERVRETQKKASETLRMPRFKKIVDEWDKKSKPNYEPKWYSLFNGPANLKQLVDRVGDKKYYRFYGLLSKEAHAYQALNGVYKLDLVNEPFSLKPIRNPKKDAGYHEEIARS